MTAQKGKDLLLKVDSDGAGSFTTVAGLRARTLAFNAASVDITDQESAAAGASSWKAPASRRRAWPSRL
jgi:TP901-1 family phage major tail protein